MHAVIQTGGQQYRVAEGDVIEVNLLGVEPGAEVTFDDVKLVEREGAVAVGAPRVAGAKVTGSVLATVKMPKVIGISFRRRKGSKVKKGHRQRKQRVRITAISA